MMKISNIIDYLCNQFDSQEYDKEILQYGLGVLIYNFITIVILFLMSILFQNLKFGLIFIPIFCLLRMTIGGFHCKKLHTCLMLMITLYSLILILIETHNYRTLLHTIAPLLIFSLLFIKPCEKNTIHFHQHAIGYKYFLVIFFSFMHVTFKLKFSFIPIFSALLLVEILYSMQIAKNIQNITNKQ